MIEQYTSPAVVNNSQEPWLVGEGVSLSGSIAIPSLNFNFVTDAFPGTVTFTRASTATYFDSAGVLQSAAIDAPRFDYNPATLAAQGLLIEEARTNSIRNNTMVGAVAGTPGTLPTNWTYGQLSALTTEIVGNGTETGINYVDIRLSGTATTTPLIYFEANSTVAATNNQTWVTSVFVKIVGGNITNITIPTTTLRMSDSGGANLGFVPGSAYTLPTSATPLSECRFSSSHTTNNASTAFVMPALAFNAAGAIDITLRIGLPQLELGAFATSVIPTTTTALTRSADVASVNTLSPWYNQTEGTLFADVLSCRSSNRIAMFDDGSTNNRWEIRAISNIPVLNSWSGGVQDVISLTSGVPLGNPLAPFKAAAANKTNDAAISVNAAPVGTDASCAMPLNQTRLFIGSFQGTATFLNGYLRRITYYPRRLSNAELQAITA